MCEQETQPGRPGTLCVFLAVGHEINAGLSQQVFDQLASVGFVSKDPGVLRQVEVELFEGTGITE